MARSPHRLRGDPAECWERLLFGEILRAADRPVSVLAEPTILLPKSGRWETGLARLRPALDDALGSTALAVAWRWACAETAGHAWPGWPLLARVATDRTVTTHDAGPRAVLLGPRPVDVEEAPAPGSRSWTLLLPEGRSVTVGVPIVVEGRWEEVDRIADIAAAWLGAPWRRTG
jgi:hypothetical protein